MLTIRPARSGDVAACADVVVASIEDLVRRQGRPPVRLSADVERPILEHGLRTAPAAFHVAEEDGRVVAFASAFPRDGHWFVGFLFARLCPSGRALAPAPPGANRFLFASTDPRAMGLYVAHGLLPWATCLAYTVPVPAERDLPETPLHVAPLGVVDADFDRAAFGYARAADAALLLGMGARGHRLEDATRRFAGYFHLTPDARIAPFALAESRHVAPALDAALAEAREAGLDEVGLRVPAANVEALRWCAARRGRLATVNLVMSTRPLAALDRVGLGPPGLM